MKFGNGGGELSYGELLAFDCCCLYVDERIFGCGGIGNIIEGINEVNRSIGSGCCMDLKDRMLVGCHVVHFSIVGLFFGPKGFPRVPDFWAMGSLFNCLYASLNMPMEMACVDPGVDHYFGADGDCCISCKGLELFFLLDVDSKRFIVVYWLDEEGFVVINHVFGDEGKAVEYVEDDLVEGALAVPFIRVP